MSDTARLSTDGKTLTVRVPLQLKRRGGRKVVVAPDGHDWPPATPKLDNALVKALARAFRWQRMLESGEHISIAQIAASEKINGPYVGRVLRLTLLAPDIVKTILDGKQPPELQLADLLHPHPVEWSAQSERFLE